MAYFNTQMFSNPKSKHDQENRSGELPVESLLEEMAKALVDYPDAVAVNRLDGKNTCVLELNVAKEDLGKVIGRSGRTANAIRTLLAAVSSKNNERVVLEIIE